MMMIRNGFYSELKIFFPGWFGGVVKFFPVSRHLTHNINIVIRTLLILNRRLNSLFSIPDKIDIHCTLTDGVKSNPGKTRLTNNWWKTPPKKILPSLFQIQYICQ